MSVYIYNITNTYLMYDKKVIMSVLLLLYKGYKNKIHHINF